MIIHAWASSLGTALVYSFVSVLAYYLISFFDSSLTYL